MLRINSKKILESFSLISKETRKVIIDAGEALRQVSFDNPRIFLIILFSALYLPHVFVLVEDLGLITGYEVDAGSHIYAIEDVLRTYNMHTAYHSKFYGWSYFVINFIILTPIKAFCSLLGIESKFYLYSTIRLILFSIGLISMIAFHEIVKKLFGNMLAFIGAVFYIFNDVGFKFFYLIHPETTGVMFVFFGILCLLKFIDRPQNQRLYFYGLSFLVLASLSKQTFFFISLPVLALFFYFQFKDEKKPFADPVIRKKFIKTIYHSAIIAFALLFVIHPYAILEFNKFLDYQKEIRALFWGLYSVKPYEAFQQWIEVFLENPIIKLSLFVAPFSLILGIIYYLKFRTAKPLLYITNLLGIILISGLICFGNRLFIEGSYLQPLYPFFIINFLSIILFVKNTDLKKFKILQNIASVFFVYFIILSLTSSVYKNIPRMLDRFYYRDSVAFLTYQYLAENILPQDKIAYDSYVGIPDAIKKQGCHYWQGCGQDYIDEYMPNYVIFNEEYETNGTKTLETERLKRYAEENNLTLIKEINGRDINGRDINSMNVTISVYKK